MSRGWAVGLALCALCALRPTSVEAGTVGLWRLNEKTGVLVAASRGDRLANPTDTKLNLGADDWTVECWLRLDASAKEEGVILEIGSDSRGKNQLVTRLSVLPVENAFVLAGITSAAPRPGAITPARIERAVPDGPPAAPLYPEVNALALHGTPLPRGTWMHVAFVHSGLVREVRLFVDGKFRAVAAVTLEALPHADEAYVAIGRDGREQHPLRGAVDELRITDTADYRADFTPRRAR